MKISKTEYILAYLRQAEDNGDTVHMGDAEYSWKHIQKGSEADITWVKENLLFHLPVVQKDSQEFVEI